MILKTNLEMLALSEIKRYISSKIKKENFVDYWKKAKERTSSSISRLLFGHYESATENKIATKLHKMFLDSMITTGSVIDWWIKILLVMLEKIKGNINVEKLRGILLMEVGYNFLSKFLLGVRLMRSAELRNEFPKELGGSRKRHEAIDVTLNRKLVGDIMRQMRRPGTITGMDAVSCYDILYIL